MHKFLLFFLAALCLLPLAERAQSVKQEESRATLVVEYGLDSLERRYYRPRFRFDFPSGAVNLFSEIQYHSHMNGRLQGAIDYWVNAGLQKKINEQLILELRLNHFCRHETVRHIPYVWNLNELLGRVALERGGMALALGAGVFIGGSEGYRQLATAGASWRGVLLPELSLEVELKLVNFRHLYHELGFSLALNRTLEIFFRNARPYEFANASTVGARLRSGDGGDAFLDIIKMRVGASPFDDMLKLEVEGGFKMEFFKNGSRRVALAIDFEAPILNGDTFFAQFRPWKMIYDIGLDYEQRFTRGLVGAWVTRYRLDQPVDDDRPFVASLFTGLALRNQSDFDVLENDLRYEVTAGYDFKHGLEAGGRIGLGIWRSRSVKLIAEMKGGVGNDRLRLDLRLLAAGGGTVEWRPYLGWKKDFYLDSEREMPGKLLFGLGFFKKFQ